MNDYISRQWLMACVNEGWIKFDTEKDENRFIHLVRDIAPSAQPEQRWIPCNDRMPDEDYWTGANFQYSADVLMTVYNAEDEETIIDYGHTADGSWYSDTTDGLVPPWWKVLAWMPLPEPYKEVEQNG